MLLLLSIGAIATKGVLELTPENFEEFIQSSSRHPAIVKAYLGPCPHCQEFEEIWEPFAASWRKQSKQVQLAQIDCIDNQKLCRDLPCSGYPCVLWYNGIKDEPVLQQLPEDINQMITLGAKLIKEPLTYLDAPSDAKRPCDTKLMFVLECESLKSEAALDFLALTEDRQAEDTVFAVARASKTRLQCYLFGQNIGSVEHGDGFKEFIDQQMAINFPVLDKERYKAFQNSGSKFYIVVVDRNQKLSAYRKVANTLLKLGQTSYIEYDSSLLSDMLGNVLELPHLIEHGSHGFRTYTGKMNDRDILRWVHVKEPKPRSGVFAGSVLLVLMAACVGVWRIVQKMRRSKVSYYNAALAYPISLPDIPMEDGDEPLMGAGVPE